MSDSKPTHPSVLNRVARRLSRLRKRAEEGIQALNDEASHPGEPQPHRRGHSPFHRTVADLDAAEQTPSAAYRPGGDPTVDPLARPAQDHRAGQDAWYLQGEDEGWTATNPTHSDDDGD